MGVARLSIGGEDVLRWEEGDGGVTCKGLRTGGAAGTGGGLLA